MHKLYPIKAGGGRTSLLTGALPKGGRAHDPYIQWRKRDARCADHAEFVPRCKQHQLGLCSYTHLAGLIRSHLKRGKWHGIAAEIWGVNHVFSDIYSIAGWHRDFNRLWLKHARQQSRAGNCCGGLISETFQGVTI